MTIKFLSEFSKLTLIATIPTPETLEGNAVPPLPPLFIYVHTYLRGEENTVSIVIILVAEAFPKIWVLPCC